MAKIRRRGKSWHALVYLGRGADGKPVRRSVTRPTKREVEEEVARLKAEYRQGTYIQPSKLTVAEFLQQWIRTYPIDSPTTRASYEMLVREHFIPSLGHIPLAKLSPMHLQEYYQDRLERGNLKKPGAGLSPTTVRYHHRVLAVALETAVRWRLIPENVARLVIPPKKRHFEPAIWTPEEGARFLEVIAGHRMFAFYVAAMLTGLRRGELFGLRWPDVDWEGSRLLVVRTTIMARDPATDLLRPVTKDTPKWSKARRAISISEFMLRTLARHRAEQEIERAQLGEAYHDEGWIFCRPDGRRYSMNSITGKQFNRLLEKAGVPKIRFHDLRHTHASWMLLNGEHPKVVQGRLGHSSITVTMDLYSHLMEGQDRDAVERIDSLLQRARPGRLLGPLAR